MDGQVSIDENVFASQGFTGLTFRTLDVAAQRWAIYWISSRDGRVQPPVPGGWNGDIGGFVGDDEDDGRPVRVRFLWERLGPDRARWSQDFALVGQDGGRRPVGDELGDGDAPRQGLTASTRRRRPPAGVGEVRRHEAVAQRHERRLDELVEQPAHRDAGQRDDRQPRAVRHAQRLQLLRDEVRQRLVRQVGRVRPQRELVGARDAPAHRARRRAQRGRHQHGERQRDQRIAEAGHEEAPAVAVDVVVAAPPASASRRRPRRRPRSSRLPRAISRSQVGRWKFFSIAIATPGMNSSKRHRVS